MWSPLDYASAAVVPREASDELFSRLEWMSIKPSVVVDMGCGTGEMSSRLQARYADAVVIALDINDQMIQHTKHHTPSLASVCGDTLRLPFRDQSVDLIFANLLLPWQEDIKKIFCEWRRVLRAEGVVIFTAFGPDTMKEWHESLQHTMIPHLIDMHDIGDLMIQEKFSDPVLDINHYTLNYQDQQHLFKELQATGMLSSIPVVSQKNIMSVTYEIIFAHAFVPAKSEELSASSDGIVRVPLNHLRQRLKAGSK